MSHFYLILVFCACVHSENTIFTSTDVDYELGDFLAPNISEFSDSDSMQITPSVTSLTRVLDFFNSEILVANWNRVQKEVSQSCQENMQIYIDGLIATDSWAVKMEDASGRYTSGWFWGNHYWAGSQSLCQNIVKRGHVEKLLRESRTNSSFRDVAGKSRGLSQPPFHPAFFMLRVNLQSTSITEARKLHVGLCLPLICTDKDVQTIMESTSKASKTVKMSVEAVRSEHQHFDIWQDTTFLILCVVTFWVILLLICGTAYDFYIESLWKEKKPIQMDSKPYTIPQAAVEDKTIKLDITDTKMCDGQQECNDTSNDNKDIKPPESPDNSVLQIKFSKYFIYSMTRRVLLAFSVRVNFNNIFNKSVGSDTVVVIHGLKSISMVWVILAHTCIVAFKYADNKEYRGVVQKQILFQTITSGAFSVDTFFFTSGLLVAFLYFRTNAKGKLDHLIMENVGGFVSGIMHFLGLVMYRFARLTAPYLFVLGVVEVCMKWFNYNSVFEPPTLDHENCPRYWWRNVLYINTLFPAEEMCMVWSWYLSNDTQFYVIGAILLIIATRHFKSSAFLLVILLTSSWLTTGFIAFTNNHMPGLDDPLALYDKIYDKPWTRLGPYLIGIGVGWILFKTNCQISMSKKTVIAGWITSIACLLSLVYGLYDVEVTPAIGALYSSLSHSAWALGLAWVVIACTTGHGGYVNTILSAPILYPFSRVTYCAYLLHPMVVRLMAMSMDHPMHLGLVVMAITFLGQLAASYALAFAVSIAFEGPSVSMLRILSRLTLRNPMKKDWK